VEARYLEWAVKECDAVAKIDRGKLSMRKLFFAAVVATTVALGGAIGWQANAAPHAGPLPQAGPYTPIHPAACVGHNVHCRPGHHWVCGPEGKRCWCEPC